MADHEEVEAAVKTLVGHCCPDFSTSGGGPEAVFAPGVWAKILAAIMQLVPILIGLIHPVAPTPAPVPSPVVES